MLGAKPEALLSSFTLPCTPRRCFGESYYFLAESPSSLACTATTPDVANHGNPMTTILPKSHPGVPIHLFTRHVLERHASDNEGFRRSFEHIETLSPVSSKENLASLLPHNIEKNRYKNVLACKIHFTLVFRSAVPNASFLQMIILVFASVITRTSMRITSMPISLMASIAPEPISLRRVHYRRHSPISGKWYGSRTLT